MDDESKGSFGETIEETVRIAEKTVRRPLVRTLARFGFYAKGFLFIVIGILAIMVAVGVKSGKLAAPTGALATVARIPFGSVILIIFVIGAIGHGGWNILRGIADVDDAGGGVKGIGARILAAGIGIFYLILAWFAADIVVAARLSQADQAIQKTITAILLTLPLGAVLVVIIGISVIGAGVHECYAGISGKFQKNFRMYELKNGERRIITLLGVFSFTARALIFGLMGYFFISAAVDYNPNEAIGLDGALLTLSQTYYGKTLLFVTAAGLVCHGVLSLYEAKYRRIC